MVIDLLLKMQSNDKTTILVARRDKLRLDRRKLHSREPYREVLKRVLDEADSREEGGSMIQGSEAQKQSDRIEAILDKIVRGRLAKWSTSNRSHERILFDDVAKNE
jgi:hypothetical protein